MEKAKKNEKVLIKTALSNGRKVLLAAVGLVVPVRKSEDNQADALIAEKPVLSGRKNDLAVLAQELVNLSTKEAHSLTQILAREYGIVPAKSKVIVKPPYQVNEKQVQTAVPQCSKQNYYVPKKLGKVNSRPKKR